MRRKVIFLTFMVVLLDDSAKRGVTIGEDNGWAAVVFQEGSAVNGVLPCGMRIAPWLHAAGTIAWGWAGFARGLVTSRSPR